MKLIHLYNNYSIPDIAFGTGVIQKYSRNQKLNLLKYIRYFLSSIKHFKINRNLYGDINTRRILQNAYDNGFRFFDTARIYGYSEKRIGQVKGDIFIATKISKMDLERNLSTVSEILKISLNYLNKEYVDVYLLHYPEGDWLNIYSGLVQEYKKGTVKSIGICNCGIEELETIKEYKLLKPMILQIELHPLNTKVDLRKYCRDNGIVIMAHTPTARMNKKIRDSYVLRQTALKYNKSITTIIIRWHIQNGVIPVISTFNKKHMAENIDFYEFNLTKEEMENIDALNEDLVILRSKTIDDPNYIYNL